MAAVQGEEPPSGETVMSDHENEEDNELAAKKHRQLVDALSALAGGKRRRKTERTEASGQISEFHVGSGGTDEKVSLSELLQPISASPALNVVRKQLKKAQQKKAAQLPLSKEENERVIREAAYAQTSQALAKWDPVVKQNRRAEQLTFPLQQEGVTVTPVEEVISGWQARTPLEQEIFNLLHHAKQPVKDPLLTPQEKASLWTMSVEEARLRRMELQRARAVQSYYEAKARRERKIKSKKYHKVLRKSKSRKALQEFETLRKCNPQAALEQLEKMEKSRIEERMSLKHQNKGRWAKSTAIMAKYDLETRKAMQEQLARNKELTQKVSPASDSEEGGGDSESEREFIAHAVNDGPAGMEPENPWMLGKRRGEPREDPPTGPGNSGESEGEEEVSVTIANGDKTVPPLPEEPHQPPQSPVPEGPILDERLERIHTLEDMEVLESEGIPQEEAAVPPFKETEFQQPTEPKQLPPPETGASKSSKKTAKGKALIDLQAVVTGTPQVVQCPLLPTAVQDEGEKGTDQRSFIQEAFASDNVVADFAKEKRKTEQASKGEAINLVLPGWGEWGGQGLRPSNRKRRRFLIKPKPGPPRKDRHLPHVIISEKRNILAAAHQVNQLPFPFENSQQFERSIQTSVGATWNTQRVFQQLTAPRVVTQPGHIIQPITAEDAELIRKTDRTKVTGQKPDLVLKVSPRKHPKNRAMKKKAKKN